MIRGKIRPEWIVLAKALAETRRAVSRERGLRATTHSGDASGTFDYGGALGEYVIARVFGLPDPEVDSFKARPDVGPFEVEAVTRDNGDARTASLIIRPSDLEQNCAERPYLHVILHDEEDFLVDGWLWGKEGPKLGRPYEERGEPCWFVPPKELRPLDLRFWENLANWRALNA